MIQPIQIQLRPLDGRAGERIEIASGDFLGHEVGTLTCAVNPRGDLIDNVYYVNGQHFTGFASALNACMAAAYAYVAAEMSAEA